MIDGFEFETQPLTPKEMEQLKIIGKAFNRWYIGEENAVTSERIISGMKTNYNIKINACRIRKIINHIRRFYIPTLVASKKGYYIEKDPEKVKIYVESLKGRISAINAVVESIEKGILGIENQPVIDFDKIN